MPGLGESARLSLIVAVGTWGCAGGLLEPAGSETELRTWGTMREVLRDGRTQGRVLLARHAASATVGLGLLADLDAEITIDAGVCHLSSVEDGRAVRRAPRPGDRATLLAVARVGSWSVHELPEIRTVTEFEDAVRAAAHAAGIDPSGAPIPLRVEGRFLELDLHVLDHSCPIANPGGPPPWRHRAKRTRAILLGFYAEGMGGRLTHHGQRSHLHAILPQPGGKALSGHVDALRIGAGSRLQLPDRGSARAR